MSAHTPSGNVFLLGSASTPLLRAVLVAELVDTSAFIQQLGDARAVVTLRRLDQQVQELLEFTGGRLIDGADGLFAIFERPVQAVDFALRYQQALRQLWTGDAMPLTARVGIHFGDVHTWSQPTSEISVAAKPSQAEGLATPIAARLMAMALPGQILISDVARSLAQRAQADLGERAEQVRWEAHGRYRCKGVDVPMRVHEVGELGFASFRAPPSSSKVWRQLPLWQRPSVLVAQLLLILGAGGFYAFSASQSPPALAFQQRDWVVVGSVRNFTGDPRLEQVLDTALRASLEQSRFVNMVSELKVQEVLQRMGRSPEISVDRAIGSEIAMREGARALLLPSVAEVGGRLRVSVEVVDPNNQATFFTESAEGRGAESALGSIDAVNERLRKRLGESTPEVQAKSKPLELATTGNMDALRLYSLAGAARISGNLAEARRLLDMAIERDPEFALAYSDRAQVGLRSNDNRSARRDLALAQRYRRRLSLREALQVEAAVAFYGPPQAAVDQWNTLARAYPDDYASYLSAGQIEVSYLQQYTRALRTLAPALVSQNPRQRTAWYMVGLSHTALEQYPQAQLAFEKYEALGGVGFNRDNADMFAAQRKYADAERILGKHKQTGAFGMDLDKRLAEVTYPIDQGQWDKAMTALDALEEAGAAGTQLQVMTYQGTRLGLRAVAEGAAMLPDLRNYLTWQTALAIAPDEPDRDQALFAALYCAAIAARLGDVISAQRAIDQLSAKAIASGYPAQIDMLAIARAEIALANRQPESAQEGLQSRVNDSEIVQVHETLLRAYRQQGDTPAALREVAWLTSHRGRAYVEWNSMYILQPINLLSANLALLSGAELALSAGDEEQSRRWLARFEEAWPQAGDLSFVRLRLQTLQAALEQSDRDQPVSASDLRGRPSPASS